MKTQMLTVLVATLFVAMSACAQQYPSRPLRLIVPFPPGGNTDLIIRPISQQLAENLAQPVLLDHRPGANSILGAEIAARANPDGYTLLLASSSTLVANPVFYKKLPYNVLTDYTPITQVAAYSFVLVTSALFPPNSVQELVTLAKAKPRDIVYASTGNGSPSHIGAAWLESLAGIQMTHVPYKGNAGVTADMLGGTVHLTFAGLPGVESLVKSGKLKLLAVGRDTRLAAYPDLPTVAETYRGFEIGNWYGLVTRAGTPSPIVRKLNHEVIRALQTPQVKGRLESQGYDVVYGPPEAMLKLISNQTQTLRKLAADANITNSE